MPISQITANSIADGTVVAADIANGSITTAKIADANVTDAKIVAVANTKITGVLNTAQIADAAITTEKIAANAVVTADIADANVTDAKIVSVANTKITGRMTASQLANTAVTAGTYGGSSNSASITVDAQGRITSASNVAVSGGKTTYALFTSPGTWTVPATTTFATVYIAGGGGGGGGISASVPGGNAGDGGAAIVYTAVSGSYAITVGTGGNSGTNNPGVLSAQNPGQAGTSSSFGSVVSCTGGSAGTVPATPSVPGSATINSGTTLRSGYATQLVMPLLDGNAQANATVPGVSTGVAFSVTSLSGAGKGGTGSRPGTGGAVLVEFIS